MDDRSYGSRWSETLTGVGLGVVATGSGLAVGEILVGIIDKSSSPVISVGNKVIDLVPLGLKNWAIETFGTSDKTVLVVTTLFLVFVAGAIIGVIAMNGHRRDAFIGTGLVGLAAMWAVMSRPDHTVAKLTPILAGTAVSLAVLWWLTPDPSPSSNTAVARAPLVPVNAAPYVPMTIPRTGAADRRVFLQRSVGVAAMAGVAGGAGRLLQRRYDIADERGALTLPTVASDQSSAVSTSDLAVEGLSPFVTPNDSFYRIDTALVVPQVSKAEWKLRIHGMVDNEMELTFDDVLAREQIEAYVTLSCVSNPVGGPYVSNALWQGIRLDHLFAEVGVDPTSDQLVSTSYDGWTCGTPVASLTDGRDAMLAIAMNGEPLPAEHGYPVRLVVPGEYGYVSATKWVVDMEFTTFDRFDAYWVPRGWSQQAPMKTMTRIETPSGDVDAGPVVIAGTAWRVHTGISKVEVQVDDGEWMAATLAVVPSPDTWRKWKVEWNATPGDHVIQARATDGNGEVQTADVADVAPNGASGYDRISVTVR